MPHYRSVGEVPHKRHTQFRRPDGGLYSEELMGQEGFSSDSSLLYHRHPPTAIVSAETHEAPALSRSPNLPLKPRHLRTHKLDAGPVSSLCVRRWRGFNGRFGVCRHGGGANSSAETIAVGACR